ncbi:MAG: hypothetical protein R6W06_13750 [Prochlorococcaceae cyanobacterium]
MMLGTALGSVFGGLLLSTTGAAWAGDNMMDQMIRGACLKAVNNEVQASGKPAPEGMASSTCDCVVQQMKLRKSIEVAKTTCKNQAAQQYNL